MISQVLCNQRFGPKFSYKIKAALQLGVQLLLMHKSNHFRTDGVTVKYLTGNGFACAAGGDYRMSGGTTGSGSVWGQLFFLFLFWSCLSLLLIMGADMDKVAQAMSSDWLLVPLLNVTLLVPSVCVNFNFFLPRPCFVFWWRWLICSPTSWPEFGGKLARDWR